MKIDIQVTMPLGDGATVLGRGGDALAKLVTSKSAAVVALETIDFSFYYRETDSSDLEIVPIDLACYDSMVGAELCAHWVLLAAEHSREASK